jgi:hypothetical protein
MAKGRPCALLSTGGNLADVTGTAQLLASSEPSHELIADTDRAMASRVPLVALRISARLRPAITRQPVTSSPASALPPSLACIPSDLRASAFTPASFAAAHRTGLVVPDRRWLAQSSDCVAGAAKIQRKCTQISRDGREWSGVVHPPVHQRRRVLASRPLGCVPNRPAAGARRSLARWPDEQDTRAHRWRRPPVCAVVDLAGVYPAPTQERWRAC